MQAEFCSEKREGKKQFGRPRYVWEYNIKMDLQEIGWEVADWIHLAQYRTQWQILVNKVMKLLVP
jgi:hypothetical protein